MSIAVGKITVDNLRMSVGKYFRDTWFLVLKHARVRVFFKKTIYKIDRIHVSNLKGESVGEGLRIALALAFTSWNQYSIFRSVYFKVWPLAEQIDGFFFHLCCCSQKSHGYTEDILFCNYWRLYFK